LSLYDIVLLLVASCHCMILF